MRTINVFRPHDMTLSKGSNIKTGLTGPASVADVHDGSLRRLCIGEGIAIKGDIIISREVDVVQPRSSALLLLPAALGHLPKCNDVDC